MPTFNDLSWIPADEAAPGKARRGGHSLRVLEFRIIRLRRRPRLLAPVLREHARTLKRDATRLRGLADGLDAEDKAALEAAAEAVEGAAKSVVDLADRLPVPDFNRGLRY